MSIGYREKLISSEFKYRIYMTHRFIKFFPLHWICLIIILPLSLLHFEVWKISAFITNVALLQTWIPIRKIYFSFNSVSWYLADTMFFSILFPGLYKIIAFGGRSRKIMIAMLALAYLLLVVILPEDQYHAILYINPLIRLADFIFGIYLGLLHVDFQKKTEKYKQRKYYNVLINLIVITCTLLLVIESCILSDETRMIAPVYWPLVTLVIISSSLSRSPIWGGAIFNTSWWIKFYHIHDTPDNFTIYNHRI